MNKRVLWIDNLKGLLCLIVFLFHYLSVFDSLSGFTAVDELLKDGGLFHVLVDGVFAVKLFLIISAYVISKSISQGESLGNIIIKRYFRLAVPVGIACLLAYLLQFFYVIETIPLKPQQEWIKAYYPHYSIILLLKNLLFSVVSGYNDYLGVAWMLKYVFYGSFFVIIIKLSLKDKSVRSKIAILMFSFIIGYAEDALYSLVPVGVFIEEFEVFKEKVPWRNMICFLCLACGLLLHYHNRLGFSSVIASMLIMAGLFISPVLQTILSTKLLKLLGKISFSLYLVHCPVLFSITSFMVTNLNGKENNLVVLLATIAIVVIVSFLFMVIIEKWASHLLVSKAISFFNVK